MSYTRGTCPLLRLGSAARLIMPRHRSIVVRLVLCHRKARLQALICARPRSCALFLAPPPGGIWLAFAGLLDEKNWRKVQSNIAADQRQRCFLVRAREAKRESPGRPPS